MERFKDTDSPSPETGKRSAKVCADDNCSKVGSQMKTIIMLSLAVLMITAVKLLNDARVESQRLAANECQANHYACFRPAVGFASLR